jgi:hypothetical protein
LDFLAITHFNGKPAYPIFRVISNSRTEAAMRIAVAVASIKRSEEIGQLLTQLSRQSSPASKIVLSLEQVSDAPPALNSNVDVILGSRGLTRQRNRAIEAVLPDSDILVFFDDDFLPCDDALAGIVDTFSANPDIVGATGCVLRDGVTHGGLAYEEALAYLTADRSNPRAELLEFVDIDSVYGCNMAFRVSAIRELRFDENLPLYGWQEDVDFAGQLLAKGGRVVKTNAFSGVHRGVTRGRTPGVALGYSQIVNPIYLMKKGTMRPAKALNLMAGNLIANHVKSVRPEKFIDRAGRMRGNWLGLLHLLAGKTDPARILQL